MKSNNIVYIKARKIWFSNFGIIKGLDLQKVSCTKTTSNFLKSKDIDQKKPKFWVKMKILPAFYNQKKKNRDFEFRDYKNRSLQEVSGYLQTQSSKKRPLQTFWNRKELSKRFGSFNSEQKIHSTFLNRRIVAKKCSNSGFKWKYFPLFEIEGYQPTKKAEKSGFWISGL